MLLASDAQEPRISFLVTAGLLLGGALIYGLGYAMAVMRRANRDYKTTKAAVPGLRKGFWAAWRTMMKAAFWIALAVCILIFWVANDFQDMYPASDPTPSATTGR